MRFVSLLGIGLIILAAYAVSERRDKAPWRLVCMGLVLQAALGFLMLKTYPEHIFGAAEVLFKAIQRFSDIGARFLFGGLADQKDFVILSMASVIIFVSSIMAVLNYLRVVPLVMFVFARMMQKTLRTSGAETLSAAMQILMGIEAMTALKTVLHRMTRSELFTVMSCFMATMAGSVMAVYVGVFGANAGYILAASVMSAPGAIVLSKMMVPETGTPETRGNMDWRMILPGDRGIVEAAANGAIDGLRLCAFIAAILLAFVSIIHLMDALLGAAGLSFKAIGGAVLSPAAFLLGVPWEDCHKAGYLLTMKFVFNEWLSYSAMQQMIQHGELQPRTVMILTYAMCNFANFGSVAILIGGIGALAPERRREVSLLGLRALLTGLLCGFLSASIAGVLSQS
ncbi:MAG: NupC/NupG family nucleoside CNT transporter [Desulfomonilaceae bacterium]